MTIPTVLEFLDNPYRIETDAIVVSRHRNRLVLDRTVFYPGVGISPADNGEILLGNGRRIAVSHSGWLDEGSGVLQHFCDPVPDEVVPGTRVVARIDWGSRYMAMRIHTALHLVSVALPYPMLGGEIQLGSGSATFEVDNTGLDGKGLELVVQGLVQRGLSVSATWIEPPPQDLRINIRSFRWPGADGQVRAIVIDDVDRQPCDGLHVQSTIELGKVEITDLREVQEQRYRCNLRLVDRNLS